MKVVQLPFWPILMLCILCALNSCNENADDTVLWLNHLEIGIPIESVQESQPDFVEINWNKPDTAGYKTYYKVSVNGSSTILHKTHQLVFISGRFQGCSHEK